MIYELIGIAGIVLISIAPLLQLVKTLKTKEVKGISFTYFAIVFVALLCYLIYSLYIEDEIYIISNVAGLLMNGLMLLLILKYKNRIDLNDYGFAPYYGWGISKRKD